MNKQKLISLCHKVSNEKKLPFNTVLLCCFMERILKKLSQSEHSGNFIFKGGFLLANIVGMDTRSTMDIDFLLKDSPLTEDNITRIFNVAFEKTKDEDIRCTLQKVEPIKENSEYGGFRATVLCTLENIRETVQIDIATGDVVTPFPIDYQYESIFGGEQIKIFAYPLETIIAEKFQTIYSHGFLNSRSKDYYDLYILSKLKKDEIDKNILLEACKKTFEYRTTELSFDKLYSLLSDLKKDSSFQIRWNSYTKKNSYARGILFDEVISEIQKLIEWITS